jgi:hypothetical protein
MFVKSGKRRPGLGIVGSGGLALPEEMESEEDRRSRLRRLQDLLTALDGLRDDEIPPLPVLFRLSELGVKDPASQKPPVLRRRVLAIHRLYQERLPEERRVELRRGADKPIRDVPQDGAGAGTG